MIAFEVLVNGRAICTAGVGETGVLVTSVDWVAKEAHSHLQMHVGGLEIGGDEHLDWQVPELKVGDEVTIRIVERDAVDPPTSYYKSQCGPRENE